MTTAGGRVTGVATTRGRARGRGRGRCRRSLGRPPGRHGRPRPADHHLAPRHGVPRAGGRHRLAVPDRHRPPQRGYFRPEGDDADAGRARGPNEIGGSPDRADGRGVADLPRARGRSHHPPPAGDARRHVPQRAQRPGRHHPRSAGDPRAAPGRTASCLVCGFSGTGFKTAPAVGPRDERADPRRRRPLGGHRAVRAGAVRGRPALHGEHPYQALWH